MIRQIGADGRYPADVAGIAAQAQAIAQNRQPQFSGAMALHITELALALNNAGNLPQPYRMQSFF
jgi:hypothetical protein